MVDVLNNQIKCEHPVILLNPLVHELVAKYGNYTLRGKETFVSSHNSLLYGFKTYRLHPKTLQITHNDIPCCYITDYADGKRYPLYIEVGCGHCSLCKEAKVNAFVDRCRLETQLYNVKPFFITLTYDELHKKECGVCLRDVQLFLKRLRINLHRKGYRQKIRYVAVSEYGKPPRCLPSGRWTQGYRPHYHLLVWNLQAVDMRSYREIGDTIKRSWPNGFVMFRQADPRDDKSFYYTAKYLRKDCYVPSGCNGTFCVASNRGGSIGAAYYYKLRDHVKRTLNTKLKYVNKWNHRTYDVQLNRYALNKLLPSFSRSLPYSVKTRVRRFVLYYRHMRDVGEFNYLSFKGTYNRIMDVFPRYMYLPDESIKLPIPDERLNLMTRSLLDDEEAINRVLQRDIADCYSLSLLREPYLLKILSCQMKFDLNALVYKIRIRTQMAKQRLQI